MRLKRISIKGLIVLSLSMIILAACEKAAVWEKYTSQAGMYSVLMPGPVKTKVETQVHGKISIQMFSSYVDMRTSYYNVTYLDFPAEGNLNDPYHIIDSAINGFVSAAKGQIKTQSKMAMGNYPGKAVEMEVSDNPSLPGKATFYLETYLVERRMYLVVAGAYKKTDDINRFFESFAVEQVK